MKLFFKITLSLSLLIAATFAVIPLTTGIWLKNHYQEVLNHVNQSPNLSIKVLAFNRGWLHSTATVQVTMQDLWLPLDLDSALPVKTQPITLTIEQHIQNGPLVFDNLPNGQHRLALSRALIHSTSNDPRIPFSATLQINSKTHLSGFLHAPALSIKNHQESILAKNLDADFSYTAKNHALTGHLNINAATLTEQSTSQTAKQPISITVKNLVSHAALRKQNKLWYGTRSTSIGHLAFTTRAGEHAELHNTALSTSAIPQGQSTRITVKAHANQITFDEMRLKPLDLQFSLNNLNTKTLAHFAQKTDQIYQPLTTLNEEQVSKLYWPFLALIGRGLSVNLENWEMGTPQGRVHGQGELTLPDQHGIPNLLILTSQTTGNLDFQIPTHWLQMALSDFYDKHPIPSTQTPVAPQPLAQQTIRKWIANKKLIPVGNQLTASILYREGHLAINGVSPSYQAPTTQAPTKPNTKATHAS